jgi:hypothetical protein
MDSTKLQRLHDTLQKLAPKGKFGGLGLSSLVKAGKRLDSSLPNNPLYRNFVRAGHHHKRTLDEVDLDESIAEKQSEDILVVKEKKEKKEKKNKLVEIDEFQSNQIVNGNNHEEEVKDKKMKKKKKKLVEFQSEVNDSGDKNQELEWKSRKDASVDNVINRKKNKKKNKKDNQLNGDDSFNNIALVPHEVLEIENSAIYNLISTSNKKKKKKKKKKEKLNLVSNS